MENSSTSVNTSKWATVGFALAACYAAYRFGGNNAIKGAALGAMGTIIIGQVPYLQNSLVIRTA